MGTIERYAGIVAIALKINKQRLVQFRRSTLIDMGAGLTFIGIQIAFWNIVYSRIHPLPGWTLGDIYLFTALSETFVALSLSVFIVASRFWTLINSGRLDVYLVRPVDPRLFTFLLYLRLENFLRQVPAILLLLFLAGAEGSLTGLKLMVGLPLALLAATIYALIQLVAGFSAFWFGRAKAAEEITSSLLWLTRFPSTIFAPVGRAILVSVLPFGLAATEPALISGGDDAVKLVAIGMGSLAFWFVIVQIVWRYGLMRYESYGG